MHNRYIWKWLEDLACFYECGKLGRVKRLSENVEEKSWHCMFPAGSRPAGKPSWVPADATAVWNAFISQYSTLLADCQLSDANLWGSWANSPCPEASFPSGPAAKLTAFQRLLLVQVTDLCPFWLLTQRVM